MTHEDQTTEDWIQSNQYNESYILPHTRGNMANTGCLIVQIISHYPIGVNISERKTGQSERKP